MPEIPSVTIDRVPDPLPDDLTILDVREPLEWEYGHIDGAVHIPLTELIERVQEVPTGRTLVVCKVGGRSAQAVAYLNEHGREAFNLHGGMVDWADAGRPLVSDAGHPPHVV
jgi:rhodanese-related sulfurtransferase